MEYRLEQFIKDYRIRPQNKSSHKFSLADDDIFIQKLVGATVKTLIALIRSQNEKCITIEDLEEILTHYMYTYNLGLATKQQLRIK